MADSKIVKFTNSADGPIVTDDFDDFQEFVEFIEEALSIKLTHLPEKSNENEFVFQFEGEINAEVVTVGVMELRIQLEGKVKIETENLPPPEVKSVLFSIIDPNATTVYDENFVKAAKKSLKLNFGILTENVEFQEEAQLFTCKESELARLSFAVPAVQQVVKINKKDHKINLIETQTWNREEYKKRVQMVPTSATEPFAFYVKNSEPAIKKKLEAMPICAEKLLWQLFYWVKHIIDEKEYKNKAENDISPVVKELVIRLKEEGYMTETIESMIRPLHDPHNFTDKKNLEKIVLNCLQRICSLDTEILIDLVAETRKAAGILRGRDVVLVIGSSGAGKSTLVHYFAGTELQKTIEDGRAHFKPINPAKGMEAFHTSAKVDSETFSINAVEFEIVTKVTTGISINSSTDSASANVMEAETMQKKNITFCDTPGFRDTRGDEIDIANGIGISKAVRQAKTVHPVILFCNDNFDKRFKQTLEMLDTIAALIPPNPNAESIIYWFNQLQLEKLQNDFVHTGFSQKLAIMKNGDSTVKSIPLIENIISKLEANLKQPVTIDFLHQNPYDLLIPLIHNVIPPINHPSKVFRDFTSAENISKYRQQLNFHEKLIKKTWERIVEQKNNWKKAQQLIDNGEEVDNIAMKISEKPLLRQIYESYTLIGYKLNQLFQLYQSLQIDQSNTIYEATMNFLRTECNEMRKSYESQLKRCTDNISKLLSTSSNDEDWKEVPDEINGELSQCLDNALEIFWIEPILEIGKNESVSYQVSDDDEESAEPFGGSYLHELMELADKLETSINDDRYRLVDEENSGQDFSADTFKDLTANGIGMKRSIDILSHLQKLANAKRNAVKSMSEETKVSILRCQINVPNKFEGYCEELEKYMANVNSNLSCIPDELKRKTISKTDSFLEAMNLCMQPQSEGVCDPTITLKEDVLMLIGMYSKHMQIFPSDGHVESFKEMVASFEQVIDKATDYVANFFESPVSTVTLNKLKVFAWLNNNILNLHNVQSNVELIHNLVGTKLNKWHVTLEAVMNKFVQTSNELFKLSIAKPTDIAAIEKLLIIFRFFESCSTLNKYTSQVFLSWLEQVQLVKENLHADCMTCIFALNTTSWIACKPTQLITALHQYREFSKLNGKYIGEELLDIFQSLDEDGDGYLSCADLQQTTKVKWGEDASDDAIERMFKEADVNGDEKMEYSEFVCMITKNEQFLNLRSQVEEVFDNITIEKISIDYSTMSNVERLIEIYDYIIAFPKESLSAEVLFEEIFQNKLNVLRIQIEEQFTNQLFKFSKELKFDMIENYNDRWVGLELTVRLLSVVATNASPELENFRHYCVEFESCIDNMVSRSFDILINRKTSQMDALKNSTIFIGLITSLSSMRDNFKGKLSEVTLRFDNDQRKLLESMRKKCFIDVPTNLLAKWVECPHGNVPKFILAKLNECNQLEVNDLKENISLLTKLLPIDSVLVNAVNSKSKQALEAYNERLRLLIDKAIAEIESQNYNEVEKVFKKTPPTKQLLEKLNSSIEMFTNELQENVVSLEISLTDIDCCRNLLDRWTKLIDSFRLQQYFANPLKSTIAGKFRNIGDVFKSKLYGLYKGLNDFITVLQFEQVEKAMKAIQLYLLSVEGNVANCEQKLQGNMPSPKSQLIEVGKQTIVRNEIGEKVHQLLVDYSKSMTNYCNHYVSILMQADLEHIDDNKLDDDIVSLLKSNNVSNSHENAAPAVPEGTKMRRQSIGTATSNDSQHLTNLLHASLGKISPKLLKDCLIKAQQASPAYESSAVEFYQNLLKAVDTECDKQLQQLISLFGQGHSDVISKEKLVATVKDIIAAYPVSAQEKLSPSLSRMSKDIEEKKSKFRNLVNAINKNGVGSSARMIEACKILYENFNTGEYYFVMESKNEMKKWVQSSINEMKNKLKAKFDTSKDFPGISEEFEFYCMYLRICSFLSKSHGFDHFIRSFDRSHDIQDSKSKDYINNIVTEVVDFVAVPIHDASSAAPGNANAFQQIVSGLPYVQHVDLLLKEPKSSSLCKLMQWKYADRYAATFQDGLINNPLAAAKQLLSHYHTKIQEVLSMTAIDFDRLAALFQSFQNSVALYADLKRLYPKEIPTDFIDFTTYQSTVLPDKFQPMANALLSFRFTSNKSLQTINSLEKDIYYKELGNKFKIFFAAKKLQPFVPPSLVFDTSIKNIITHMKKEIELIAKSDKLTTANIARSLEGARSYYIWSDNLRAIQAAFDNSDIGKFALTKETKAKNELTEYVNNLIASFKSEKDNQKFVDQLYILKTISEDIPAVKESVDKEIDQVLNSMKETRYARLAIIGNILNNEKVKEKKAVAKKVMVDHKVFEANFVFAINQKISNFDVDDAFGVDRVTKAPVAGKARITASPALTSQNESLLRRHVTNFHSQYTITVENGLAETKMEDALQRFVDETTSISCGSRPDLSYEDKVITMMVNIFSYWTVSFAESFLHAKSDGQDTEKEKLYLKRPHMGQILALFRLFGIDKTVSDAAKAKLLEEHVESHFVQVPTGEGKSIILAVTACMLALLGYTVNCACYSEYLSERDYKAFSYLFTAFRVEEYIVYDNFQRLSNRLLKEEGGDIFANISNLVVTAGGNQSSANNSRTYASIVAGKSARAAREKILLIDEVDVFLAEDFYGSSYNPVAKLVHPTIEALIKAIWERHKSIAIKSKLNFSTISECPEYKACIQQFAGWKDLIENNVKTMLLDLLEYEKREYKIVDGDKIGYKDQDKISSSVSFGYETMWTHFKANAKGEITDQRLKSRMFMNINCGCFSYSEIPKIYKRTLGVTGTLDTLTPKELDLLADYSINKFTYIPSVFHAANRKFEPEGGDDIKVVLEQQFFNTISQEILARRVGEIPRPVLVFFESSEMLMKYYLQINEKRSDPKYASFPPNIQIITEEVSNADKESIVRKSTAADALTFLSRSFGRGTDFVIYDDVVNASGGVHVLQAFLSEDLSEEIQIRGRSARQGTLGSYSMVIHDQQIAPLKLTIDLIRTEQRKKNLYPTLLQARRECNRTQQISKQKKKVMDEDHKKGLELVNLLSSTTPNIPAIQTLINEFNQSTYKEETICASRTLILLDATKSMEVMIKEAKESITLMFRAVKTFLTEKEIQGTFEMQIGAYRNYNALEPQLFEVSDWESTPEKLVTFLSKIVTDKGLRNEAIEIGIWHANQEIAKDRIAAATDKEGLAKEHRFQVVIVGDYPANCKRETDDKREGGHTSKNYWKNTKNYKTPVYFEDQFTKLKEQGIPVHTFYLNTYAEEKFKEYAKETNGECHPLKLLATDSAQEIRQSRDEMISVITRRIVYETVGGGEIGRQMSEDFRNRVRGYIQ